MKPREWLLLMTQHVTAAIIAAQKEPPWVKEAL